MIAIVSSAQPCGCDPEANWVCAVHDTNCVMDETDCNSNDIVGKAGLEEGFDTPIVEPADLQTEIRKQHPHGHPAFLPITLREIELHSAKNHDYAKGGKPTGNFDRVAAILSLYPKLKLSDPRVVALIYAMKQVDAVLWGLSEDIQHKVEGLNDRLQDISVYSKIVECMNEDLRKG